ETLIGSRGPHYVLTAVEFNHRAPGVTCEEDVSVRQRLHVQTAIVWRLPQDFSRRPSHRDQLTRGAVVAQQDGPAVPNGLQVAIEKLDHDVIRGGMVGGFEIRLHSYSLQTLLQD